MTTSTDPVPNMDNDTSQVHAFHNKGSTRLCQHLIGLSRLIFTFQNDTVQSEDTPSTSFVLYEEDIPDVVYIGPSDCSWDTAKPCKVFLLIPDKKLIMIRTESKDLTLDKVKTLLLLKYHLPFVNPTVSLAERVLTDESILE